MTHARIQTRNLLVNWFGHGATLAVMLLLSPFIVHTLGKQDYGVWCLLIAMTGYMGLLDVGIRNSTGRYVIFHTGRNEHDDVNETIQTSLGFFALITGVLVIAAVGLGWFFPVLFGDVALKYRFVAMTILPLLAVNIWLTAFKVIVSSVLGAHDRFDLVQAVNVVSLAVRAGGTVAALSAGWGLMGLVTVVVGVELVTAAGYFVLARRVSSTLRVWPFHIRRPRLRALLTFSVWAGLAAMAYKIIHQTDLFVVGAALNVSLAAVYAVGAMLPEYIWGLVDQVCMTFFPPIQRAAASGETRRMLSSYVRQGRVALMVGLPVYLGIIVFGGVFLRLWMGGGDLTDMDLVTATRVMQVLCGARLVFLFGIGAAPLLTAMGRIKFNAAIGGVEAVVNLGLSLLFVLVFKWGLVGVAAGTLVAMAVVRGAVHPWRACVKSGLPGWVFVRKVIVPGLAVGCLFVSWCWLIRWLLPAGSWRGLFTQAGLAMVGYIPMCYFLLLFGIDRRRILNAVRTAVLGHGMDA